MENPKNYALITDGVVVNILWLSPKNADEFPGVICIEDQPISIGDLYVDGAFIHVDASGAGDPVEPEIQAEGEQPV